MTPKRGLRKRLRSKQQKWLHVASEEMLLSKVLQRFKNIQVLTRAEQYHQHDTKNCSEFASHHYSSYFFGEEKLHRCLQRIPLLYSITNNACTIRNLSIETLTNISTKIHHESHYTLVTYKYAVRVNQRLRLVGAHTRHTHGHMKNQYNT